MPELLFVSKFLALTAVYIALVAGGSYLFARLGGQATSLAHSATMVLGTHIGRLRVLILAIVATVVLTILYPGTPLLLPEGSLESLREFGHYIWYGKSRSFVPSPPDRTSWFWGQAALLYFALLALYVLLALPDVLAEAIRALRGVLGDSKEGSRRNSAILWAAIGAFIGVFATRVATEKKTQR